MKIDILGSKVNLSNMEIFVQKIDNWISNNKFINRYVCVCNVHMVMEGFDDKNFNNLINNADYVVPDGKPLVWVQKLNGYKSAKQVRGRDLTHSLCKLSEKRGYKVGFYGGTKNVLKLVYDKMATYYPELDIEYVYSPPFRTLTEIENEKIIDNINASNINILFVALGCPKQEIWMKKHSSRLRCILIGVGAAFDFISENKKESPRWLNTLGLEWLFRLISEPRRLWRRYLIQNPRFVFYFILQLLGKKYD